MDCNEILERWKRGGEHSSDGEIWDRRASFYEGGTSDGLAPMVSLIESTARPSPGSTDILDIGCGCGQYSLAFSGCARSIMCIDISEKMMDACRRGARSKGARNVSFVVSDWADYDPGSEKFDVTIAYQTPAVYSVPTFEKMLSVSSGWCYFSRYISRNSKIWNSIYDILGKGDDESDPLLFAEDILWKRGILPEVRYVREKRRSVLSLEEAERSYIDAVRGYTGITKVQEEEIRRFLGSMAADGELTDESSPVIGVLCWDMAG